MYVLGLSGGFGHDAAACLVHDGHLLAMVEEERFIRVKKAPGVAPIQAALYCLEQAKLSIEDIDAIALSWVPDHDPTAHINGLLPQMFAQHDAFYGCKIPPMEIIDHHLAHIASAYYSSGLDSASLLVIDGHGEGVSVTTGQAQGSQISFQRRYGVEQSLGHFYTSVTRHLGLGDSGEGKLMGLAGYGQPIYDIPLIHLTNDGYHIDINEPPNLTTLDRYFYTCHFWDEWLNKTFGPPLKPAYRFDLSQGKVQRNLPFTEEHHNIAASAQQKIEQVILHLAEQLIKETGCRNLVISGGVCLNSSINGVLQRSGLIDQLYIFPATNDSGGALGAAYELCRQKGPFSPELIQSAAWGPSYDDAAISATLKRLNLVAQNYDDITSVAAELLATGYVIGWFQGRSEVGPRALGQRSILANPAHTSFRERVNREIKYREPWRPFAPSILAEKADKYLLDATPSPFMLLTFEVLEQQRAKVPAIVHIDGTTRPQTVERSLNPLYWELIHSFEQKTGIPMILNTSFNLDNEPIVNSPTDALRTFFASGLDALVLGHFLLTKPHVSV